MECNTSHSSKTPTHGLTQRGMLLHHLTRDISKPLQSVSYFQYTITLVSLSLGQRGYLNT